MSGSSPVALTLAVVAGCTPDSKSDVSQAPEKLDDGWNVVSPTQFDVNLALLHSMVSRTEAGAHVNIHSVLVIKDGLLAKLQIGPLMNTIHLIV